jgi:hypothetical protein
MSSFSLAPLTTDHTTALQGLIWITAVAGDYAVRPEIPRKRGMVTREEKTRP